MSVHTVFRCDMCLSDLPPGTTVYFGTVSVGDIDAAPDTVVTKAFHFCKACARDNPVTVIVSPPSRL